MSLPRNDAAYEWLHITPNPNGTLTRPDNFFPTIPASLPFSKDVPLNPTTHTRIRLFLPQTGSDLPLNKLPIIIFIHGGGFILCSAATPVAHEFCSTAASQLTALVISVDYRLAPENRLPAAYDDVLEALTWVKHGNDEWITKYGDLSRCVMVGESAGGNIVYHAGLKAASRINDFQPLNLKGLVLIQPYFGGLNPTGSELRLVDDPVLPLNVNELMWELALPVGANRGHEYCDPGMGGGGLGLLDVVQDLGWWVGVIGSGGDPLYDRDVDLVKLMEERGLKVKSMFMKDEVHGAFVSDSTNKRKDVLDLVNEILFP